MSMPGQEEQGGNPDLVALVNKAREALDAVLAKVQGGTGTGKAEDTQLRRDDVNFGCDSGC